MYSFKKISLFVLLSFSLSAVSAVPLYKRIAQTISASTQQWEKACTAAGGGEKCNPISVTAFSTLLAAAGPCDQQNSADAMIDLAKQLNNDADMIKFAQIFAQQPRNTPNSLAVPYCQQAPNNTELNGLFQCQFTGANQQMFVGGLQAGATGTIPFGMTAVLDPAGSCPANPSGPIADGTQLVDLTQDPGLQNVQGGGGGGNETSSSDIPSPVASATDVPSATPSATDSAVDTAPTPTASMVAGGDGDTSDDCGGDDTDSDDNSSLSTDLSSASPSASSAAAVITPTITPTPTASLDSSSSVDVTPSVSSSASGAAATGDFKLQNGKDAQALNAKFASLTADSTCSEGDQACVQGGFAQCVSGQFVVQDCSGGLTCAALPLVNKAGTSLACTTEADALARIAASGATGGLTGN